MTKTQVMLSPSTLNLFLECKRCFWIDKVKKIKRPRGIFPSLPGGMDRAIKIYFDSFRLKGALPPELSGPEFGGVTLFRDQAKLDRWRDWRTGLRYEDASRAALFTGAIDDLLVKGDRYIPFDYKTKGSPTTAEDAVKYYQNQIDCYALLLSENHLPPDDHGFLIYYSPKSIQTNGSASFHIQTIKLKTDHERARSTFQKAVGLIQGAAPEVNKQCDYCMWLENARALGT